MLSSLVGQLALCSNVKKYERFTGTRPGSYADQLFTLMAEDGGVWTVDRVIECTGWPKGTITSAFRRLAQRGAIERCGEELRHTKPRYLWRAK